VGEEVHVNHGDAEQREGAHQVGQGMSDMVQDLNSSCENLRVATGPDWGVTLISMSRWLR